MELGQLVKLRAVLRELALELMVDDYNVVLVGCIVVLVDCIVVLADCIVVLVDCIVVVVANTIEELVDYMVEQLLVAEHHIDPCFAALTICHSNSPNKIR